MIVVRGPILRGHLLTALDTTVICALAETLRKRAELSLQKVGCSYGLKRIAKSRKVVVREAE
jgi:hypothetical protein